MKQYIFLSFLLHSPTIILSKILIRNRPLNKHCKIGLKGTHSHKYEADFYFYGSSSTKKVGLSSLYARSKVFQISEKQEAKNCATRRSYNGKQSKSHDHVLDYLKGNVRVITKLVSM